MSIIAKFQGSASAMPASTAANDFLVGNGSAFVKKTLAEVKTILGLDNTAISDSATATLDLAGATDGISDLDTAETALSLTLSNIPTKGVRHAPINKQSTSDLTITLAGTAMVFEIFDSANNCYTLGNDIVFSNANADTSFALNFIFTGWVDGSGNARIQVTGAFNSFTAS